jgi:CRISPR-associated protein (TIGR03986 family)
MGTDYIETDKTFVNPYHFIELARQLEKKFKYQDRKAEGALTGWLECTLETKSSIFIPNTTSVEEDGKGGNFSDVFEIRTTPKNPEDKAEIVKSYDFYSYTNLAGQKHPPEPVPVIPGSEIRGMVRSAFEAVTNSCLSTIDDEQKLYKRVQTPAKPGRLVFENNQWKIIECGKYRLPKSWLNEKRPPILIHGKEYREGQPVFIKINYKNFKVLEISQQAGRELKPGFLHIGEYNENKNYEAVFVPRKDKQSQKILEKRLNQEQVPAILSNLLENVLLYCAKQNKTDKHYQYKHFQLDENQLKGVLRLAQRYDGQQMTIVEFNRILQHDFKKVFDYLNGACIYFVSRRGMHGERYYLSPAAIGREIFYNKLTDLIGSFTPCTKLDHLCEACAVFGIAGKEEAAASRIRFTDAHVQGAYQFAQPQTLQELASPKLSATEFYLKKPQGADLWNYDYAVNWRNAKFGIANHTPEIRGRKFYWHQKDVDVEHKGEATERNVHVRPLKKGKFSFKVYFNNITKDELHKLLWVLEIGGKDSHAHKIGMGKPIGLGSVQIRVDRIITRKLAIDGKTVKYDLDDQYEKPDYANVQEQFPFPKGVKQFLKITDFENAPANVSYPYNEVAKSKDAPDGKSPTYEWFGANKQIQGTGGTGTAPVINEALPEWKDKDFPKLPVYKDKAKH